MIVYQALSPSGKSYIGKTAFSLTKRWKEHCAIKTGGYALHAAINRHGADNFLLQELAATDTNESLNNLEKLWIILLQTTDSRYGYNETLGGDGVLKGIHLSEEHKKAISRGNSGKTRSPEHCLKISLNKRGEKSTCHKLTEGQVKEIRQKYVPWKYTRGMLAIRYGVTPANIQAILERKTWKYI